MKGSNVQMSYRRRQIHIHASFLIAGLLFNAPVNAQVASGGSYSLEKTVVANGGRASSNGFYDIDGTIAQSVAGTQSSSGSYGVHGGFWNAFFPPTAAPVTISGQVLTAGGVAIGGVRLSLFDSSGNVRQSISSGFGYFYFNDVEVGQTYILIAASKRFQFTPRIFGVVDSISDLVIIGTP